MLFVVLGNIAFHAFLTMYLISKDKCADTQAPGAIITLTHECLLNLTYRCFWTFFSPTTLPKLYGNQIVEHSFITATSR